MLIELFDNVSKAPIILDDLQAAEQMVAHTAQSGRFVIVTRSPEDTTEQGV